MSDLENKLLLIDRMQHVAIRAVELDDSFQDILGIIISRHWDTTGAPTDQELTGLGIPATAIGDFVNLMVQYNNLMANRAVVPLNGRLVADAIRLLR